jgi:predicted TIM-barrel fold metal-dependent hydrolase
MFGLEDYNLLMACARVYNDYVAEYCSHAPNRLFGVSVNCLDNIEVAVKELERCAKLGFRGVSLPTSPLPEIPYSSPECDPFWARAQELGIPVSLHAAVPRRQAIMSQKTDAIKRYMVGSYPVQNALTELICGGVFDRFPKLRIISVEHDVSWVPHFIYRMDHGVARFGSLQGLDLKQTPSDYFRQNILLTFQFNEGEDSLAFARKRLGAETLMWGSDYPHNDGTWPHSQQVIASFRDQFGDEDLKKILNTNVTNLYNLPDPTPQRLDRAA